MAQVIDGRRLCVCRFCTRPYTQRNRLHRHLKTVHTDEIEAETIEQNKRKITDDGSEVPVKKAKVGEFKCRYCENTYDKKYNRDLHERSTHEGDVIRDAPVEVIGGCGRKRKTNCQHVRNVLNGQRPEKSEKEKMSCVIYTFRNSDPANIQRMPYINTRLQEIKEKCIDAIFNESRQQSQGIKYMTVMELVFKRLVMDKQQYEWMHQPVIYNSKMQELVYGK